MFGYPSGSREKKSHSRPGGIAEISWKNWRKLEISCNLKKKCEETSYRFAFYSICSALPPECIKTEMVTLAPVPKTYEASHEPWDAMGHHGKRFPLDFWPMGFLAPWDLLPHGNGRPMHRPMEVRHSMGIAVLWENSWRLEIKVPLYMPHSRYHFTCHEVNF